MGGQEQRAAKRLERYAKQDRAGENPARTVALSAQDLSKLCDMVAENVVKQLAKSLRVKPDQHSEDAGR